MADIQERFVKIGEKILYEGVELTLREVLRDTNGHIWGIAISNCGTPYILTDDDLSDETITVEVYLDFPMPKTGLSITKKKGKK
mgnify:CR=1 FL=1